MCVCVYIYIYIYMIYVNIRTHIHLMLYPGHLLGKSYPSGEMESGYSTAPAEG